MWIQDLSDLLFPREKSWVSPSLNGYVSLKSLTYWSVRYYKLWTLIWNDFHYNFLINMVVLNCAYILEETFYYVDIWYYICHCQMLFQYRVKVNLNYICSQMLFWYEIKRTLEKFSKKRKVDFVREIKYLILKKISI